MFNQKINSKSKLNSVWVFKKDMLYENKHLTFDDLILIKIYEELYKELKENNYKEHHSVNFTKNKNLS
jgi:hypothetical protein